MTDDEYRVNMASDKTPEFGVGRDGTSEDFINEVVWVKSASYEGLGYCDDDGDENEFMVYPGNLFGDCMAVAASEMRLATKDELRAWWKAQAKARSNQ